MTWSTVAMTDYELIQRPERDMLGEGAFWDAQDQAFYWVDIVGRRVHRFDLVGGEVARWATPRHVSSAIPTTRGDLMVSMADGLHRLAAATGDLTHFASPEQDLGNRSNECRTDPQGRIWLGTMCNNLGPDGEAVAIDRYSGSMFCVTADGGSRRMISDVGITNTLCWSPDGRRLYTADSMTGVIWVYDYDPDGPAISNRRVFVEHGPGAPDGSAIDEEGRLWNARWGAARVICYTPDGKVDRELHLPAAQPTSCAFGGPDRKTLYITSARQELDGLAADSLDGAVFMVQLNVAGLPMARFDG
jgi:sugar lactone lactonase YvrE